MLEWSRLAAEAAAVPAVGESQRFCAPALIGCIFVVGGGSVKGGDEEIAGQILRTAPGARTAALRRSRENLLGLGGDLKLGAADGADLDDGYRLSKFGLAGWDR